MREFGHLPKRGETRSIGRFRFKVLHADSRRIHLLQLSVTDDAPADADGPLSATHSSR
jgi:magnesium and cobalt transporter